MRRAERLGKREPAVSPTLLNVVRQISRPLRTPQDLDPLLERIGDAHYVLLGEASHGTHEYYTWRAEISKRLIREKGFSFIAVEGDWPDCYRINRYMKSRPDAEGDAHEVLRGFRRWPTWMWANEEIESLMEWLREHNRGQADERKVGFYGLDVYSLWDSLYAVMGYIQKTNPAALPAARKAFRCFEPYGEDVQDYARATLWVPASCEDEAVKLLAELRRHLPQYGNDGNESHFNAEQNALIVKNAEHYYRTMVHGGPESWNVRDRHMVESLDRLMRFHGPTAKCIVWEHNTHVGDARFTDMADDDMFNVGQLVREGHFRDGVAIVGFGSYQGSVIAGDEWDAPAEEMRVPPGRADSWEEVLHRAGAQDKLLIFSDATDQDKLADWRGHRAIGVVFHPEYEALGNYVPTRLPRRYDAFLYIDRTQALRPIRVREVDEAEAPETFPTGV